MSLLKKKKNQNQLTTKPLLIVVMGVSGSGKSTLASEFARRNKFTFLDADSLHSAQAIKQMSQGIPLTDEQRLPWIKRIYNKLIESHGLKENCILAYSGLKKAHRKVVFSSYEYKIGVLLKANQELIIQRFASRSNHFMSSQLLDSQFAEMEPFDHKEPLLALNSADSVEDLLKQLENFMLSVTQKI